jgi:hypothetical protein
MEEQEEESKEFDLSIRKPSLSQAPQNKMDLSKIVYKTQFIGRDLSMTYKFDDYFKVDIKDKIKQGLDVKLCSLEFYTHGNAIYGLGIHYKIDGVITRYLHRSPGTNVDSLKHKSFQLDDDDCIEMFYCNTYKNYINFVYI